MDASDGLSPLDARSLCLTDDSISALGTTIASLWPYGARPYGYGEAMESDLTAALVLSAMLIVVSFGSESKAICCYNCQNALHFGNMIPRICNLPVSLSYFLLGPRQTGKSTLINALLPEGSFRVNLLHRDRFLQLSKDPSLLRREVDAWLAHGQTTRRVLFIDEIQRLPVLLDEVHDLIERYKHLQVILTGSSARKLKRSQVNLGGGRLLENHLFPFSTEELGAAFELESVVRFGTLPSLFVTETENGTQQVRRRSDTECRDLLRAYVSLYLKEEVQEEALTRHIGDFSRFLDVAAVQNGEVLNVSNIARECAVDRKTVSAYFSILEDTLTLRSF